MYIPATASNSLPPAAGQRAVDGFEALAVAADDDAPRSVCSDTQATPDPGVQAPLEPFLRTLGHELRNVMGTIAVSVEVVRSGAGGEAAGRSALEILDRQTARMECVLSTALELARAIEGQLKLSFCRVELGELLAQVIASLPSRLPMLSLHLGPPAWVEADPIYLAQAIKDLCTGLLGSASTPHDMAAPQQGRAEIIAGEGTWLLRFNAAPGSSGVASSALLRSAPVALGLDGLLACQIVQLHGGATHRLPAEQGTGFTLVLPRAGGADKSRLAD